MSPRLRIPGRPIARKVAMRPIGYTRSGRAVWPIAGASPAWSAVTSRGGAGSNTSGTTIAMSPSAAIAVDKIAFVWCVADNISTTNNAASSDHSVSDTDGHTWTKLKEWTRSDGAAADGITTSLFATRVTSEIGTADTITITFTSAITAKVMGAGEATVAASQTFELEPSSDVAAVGTSTSPSVANSALASQEYLFIGVLGYEAVPTITADADYTLLNEASAGAGLAGVKGYCSTRIATLAGDAYNPTGSLSRDFSVILVALDEVAAGGAGVATPATVAAIASVPAPTARGAGRTTPGTVAAIAAVPAPTARGAARTSPATVAAIAAVPPPTSVGGSGGVPGVATPGTVAAIAAVPAPTARGRGRSTPGTVAAIAAVPAPTARGRGRSTPGTVAAIASVPVPTARGAARATPMTVAAIAAVPPPSSVGGQAVLMGDFDQRGVTPDLVSVASGSEIGTGARGSE